MIPKQIAHSLTAAYRRSQPTQLGAMVKSEHPPAPIINSSVSNELNRFLERVPEKQKYVVHHTTT